MTDSISHRYMSTRPQPGRRLSNHHTVASLANRVDFDESMLQNNHRKRYTTAPESPRKRIKTTHEPTNYWNENMKFTLPEYNKPTKSKLQKYRERREEMQRKKYHAPPTTITVQKKKDEGDKPNYWNQALRFDSPHLQNEKRTRSLLPPERPVLNTMPVPSSFNNERSTRPNYWSKAQRFTPDLVRAAPQTNKPQSSRDKRIADLRARLDRFK